MQAINMTNEKHINGAALKGWVMLMEFLQTFNDYKSITTIAFKP